MFDAQHRRKSRGKHVVTPTSRRIRLVVLARVSLDRPHFLLL